MNFRRSIPALGAFFVAAAFAGCGDSVPENAVVKVDDTAIERSTFDHWMQVAASTSQGQAGEATRVSIPKPPEYTECVADKKKTAPKPAKGQPRPTDDQFKTQCKQEYESLRDQVLSFLIAAQWVQKEANDQGVKISDSEINKRLEETKKQSFPKEADFQKFLKDSGMNLQDVKFRVRVEQLQQKLVEKITKGKDQVNDQQIKAYYEKNKERFAQPERRDLRVVLTRDEAKAQEAKKAIEGGSSFKDVAGKFSIDETSKAQGGALLGVTKGQQDRALDEAVFKAERGQLQGPVKTQFGFYVFQVQKVTKASQQELKEVRDQIKQALQSENQQKALDQFIKDYRDKWKDKTNCREGFVTQECKNAPKQDTNTQQVPGQPQGAPPQNGVPPQDGGAPPQNGAPQEVPVPQDGAPEQEVPVQP
jgi:foldase protein PrsA